MNTDKVETVEGQPVDLPGTKKNKKKVIVGSAIGVCVLVLLSVVFSDQLYTAAIAPLLFKVTASPTKVVQGAQLTLKWSSNPTNRAKYPYERVAFCVVVKGKNGNCKNMVMVTPNDGREKVTADIGPGTYRAILQAVDANKNLVPAVFVSSNGFKVLAASKTSNGRSGGGGGGSSSFDDSSDVDSITTPTPPLPYEPYSPGNVTPTPEPPMPYAVEPKISLACPPPYVDVNGDGKITADDVTPVNNYLNGGRSPVLKTGATWQNQLNPVDVDGNGTVAPLDSLRVVNAVNQGTGEIAVKDCPPSPYAGN